MTSTVNRRKMEHKSKSFNSKKDQQMNGKEAIEILVKDFPKYSIEFENLYALYDGHSGSKERAFKIFESKWKDKNIEALTVVINMYIEDLIKIGSLDFKPHFENFLHNGLESYILKKQKEF